jgi:two-component system, chemotaxis family, sensor kinase CheA
MSLDLDMAEIHAIFFEESAEGVDVMESGLLNLTPETTDIETINNIFRAAHSMKGGAATFGFLDISGFTHGVETILDQMRSSQRDATEEVIEVLLASVDCIRDMLNAAQQQSEADTANIDSVQRRIDALLNSETAAVKAPVDVKKVTQSSSGALKAWKIHYAPDGNIFKTGNEPKRLLRELASMGEISVISTLSKDADFESMDPESCYTCWDIELRGEVEKDAILDVFEWVSNQSEVRIEALEVMADHIVVPISESASVPETKVAAPKQLATQSAPKDSGSIRVSIDKIDMLLNLVGELVITQSMLARFGDRDTGGNDTQGLRDGLLVLERHTRELQESAMQIRMLPIGASFSRFKRLVRDMSTKLGKKVELQLSGENTELDKTVLEKMSDPLVHLVRNSLDHGIEMPADRIAAGKPETGILHLSAYHEGGNIVIKVSDDGAGLNQKKILEKAIERGIVAPGEVLSDDQINNLIFQPGFSTADKVSDLSGRGVGMDVVRRNIMDLGGRVDLQSTLGKGSTLKIRLPLTLAILDGQLVRVGDQVYIFSLLSIVETVLVSKGQISKVVGTGNVYRLREDYIPVIRLREAFDMASESLFSESEEKKGELLVVVESDGKKMGLFVDELLEQQQVVIKSLEENYLPVKGLAGATILGDGNVALIIDVPGLVHSMDMRQLEKTPQSSAA